MHKINKNCKHCQSASMPAFFSKWTPRQIISIAQWENGAIHIAHWVKLGRNWYALMNDGPGPMVFCNVSCLIESWSVVFYCGGIMRSGSLVELSFGLQFASSKSIVMSGQPFLLWSHIMGGTVITFLMIFDCWELSQHSHFSLPGFKMSKYLSKHFRAPL